MNEKIKSNMQRITISEHSFYSKMQDKRISVSNLTERYKNKQTEIVLFRELEYRFAVATMNCSRKNNLAVIGGSGVGKTSFIHYLAKFIPLVLPEYTLAEISITSLLSGCAYRGEFEEKLITVIESAVKNKVIIYFDEAHVLSMTGGVNSGGIDAINILKPYLTQEFRCIISTTSSEALVIKDDIAFNRRFRFLELQPLNFDMKKKIINSNFGHGGVVNNYLSDISCHEKDVHEMIDDVDFLISSDSILEIENEIYIK